MKLIKIIAYSNLLISFSAGFMSYALTHYLEIDKAIFYGIFVFSSTLFTYNIQRLIKGNSNLQNNSSHRIEWIAHHRKLLVVFTLFGGVSAAFVFFTELFCWKSLGLLTPMLIVSIFYALKFNKKSNLRDLPYLKIHLIAIVWVGACLILPVLNENSALELHSNHIIIALSFYLYIIAITIPFDIRDMEIDNDNQKTIPQTIGIYKSKLLAVSLGVISLLLLFLIPLSTTHIVLLILAYAVQIVLILTTNNQKKELFFSGLIDGSIVLLALAFFF